jgi:hypothetical protein
MGSLQQRQKQKELKKRVLSFSVTAGGVVLAFTASKLLGLSAVAIGVYLAWDWFRFRAKHGMRF